MNKQRLSFLNLFSQMNFFSLVHTGTTEALLLNDNTTNDAHSLLDSVCHIVSPTIARTPSCVSHDERSSRDIVLSPMDASSPEPNLVE